MIKPASQCSNPLQTNNISLSNYIFGEKKASISTHSATRYLDTASETFSSVLPPKTKENHSRRTSSYHHRQRSIYIPAEFHNETSVQVSKIRESPVHTHNLSDADSVVYLDPGDNMSLNTTLRQKYTDHKHEFQLSMVETASGSILSTEKPKKDLECFGNNATTAYCRYCKVDVHTIVDFNSSYNSKFLKAISSVVACCNYPNWFAAYRVHKCPVCSLVLGKSR